jgi:hypothetical protein
MGINSDSERLLKRIPIKWVLNRAPLKGVLEIIPVKRVLKKIQLCWFRRGITCQREVAMRWYASGMEVNMQKDERRRSGDLSLS